MVNHFWQNVDAILEDVSETETIFLMLKHLFKDYHISVFQKLRHSDTYSQVKSCTKHDRPDQSQRKLTVALKRFYGGISAFSKVKKIKYTDKSKHKSQMLKKKKSFDGWIPRN